MENSSPVEINLGKGVAIISTPGNSAVVNLGVYMADNGEIKSGASVNEDIDPSVDFVNWGTNNDYPVLISQDAELDTVITPGIRLKTEMHFSGGVSHGKIEITNDGDGEETFRNMRDTDVVKFFRANKIDKQVYHTLYDLNYYSTAVVLFVLSNDRRKIVRYSSEIARAKFIRLGKKNAYGEVENIFLNKDFGTAQYDAEKSKKIPVIPAFGGVEWLKSKLPDTAAYLIQLPDSGRDYYPMSDWLSARNSHWLTISKNIAVFKKYMMDNQMTIKYHIEVHKDYWPERFGETTWAKWTPDERVSGMSTELTAWANFFKGSDKSGNSLMTTMKSSLSDPGKIYSLVKITEVGAKFSKEGTYIEDSKEASEHKISALGLHPDMVGNAPGSSLGSGSGSGNRNAFNQRTAMAKAIQTFALEPLDLVRDFNGWDPELEFRMRPSLITTLDTGAAATKPQATP